MKLGLLLHDPEEEHDCFSDNTHISHLYDAIGIRDAYRGRYKRIDGIVVEGPSLSSLVKEADPALDAELSAKLDATVAKMEAIKKRAEGGEAYDQQIGEGNAEGNATVQAAIDALIDQTKSIERAVDVAEARRHRLRRLRQPRCARQGVPVGANLHRSQRARERSRRQPAVESERKHADLPLQRHHREGDRTDDRRPARRGCLAAHRAREGLSPPAEARSLLRLLPKCGGNDHSGHRRLPRPLGGDGACDIVSHLDRVRELRVQYGSRHHERRKAGHRAA